MTIKALSFLQVIVKPGLYRFDESHPGNLFMTPDTVGLYSLFPGFADKNHLGLVAKRENGCMP
jgi:hypothetical protein